MDVYNLINSRAIAEHCRKIQHQFNTEEIAVLIYRNKTMSIDEKIQAYNELISDYPDMEVIERINCAHYNSVKDMIQKEITRLNTLVDKLKQDELDVIYTFDAYYKSINMYRYSNKLDDVYKTFTETLNAVTEEIAEDDDILMFKLYKKSLENAFSQIVAEYIVNADNQAIMINVYDTKNYDLDIDNIFINLPTPFKKGDVLIAYNDVPNSYATILPKKENVFVLDWLCTWQEDLKEKLADGNYDSSDMWAKGYYLTDDNNIEHNLKLDHQFNYDSFEYCEDELQGSYRILKGISSLLKDEIALITFLDVYNKIRAESTQPFLNIYTTEGLQLAGLTEDDIKRLKGTT